MPVKHLWLFRASEHFEHQIQFVFSLDFVCCFFCVCVGGCLWQSVTVSVVNELLIFNFTFVRHFYSSIVINTLSLCYLIMKGAI